MHIRRFLATVLVGRVGEMRPTYSFRMDGPVVQSWMQRIALALVLSASVGSVASAQNTQRMYEDAQRRALNGSWTRGLEIFKEIVAIDPEMPEAAWNAGLLASKLNDWETCALYYRNYLYRAPDAKDADDVRESLEKCERRIPLSGKLSIRSVDPGTSEIRVDGVVIGRGSVENVVLSAGRHTVRAEEIDYEPFQRTVEITQRGSTSVDASQAKIIYYGQLKIIVNQADASVALDGREIAITPIPEEGITVRSNPRVLLTVDKPGFHHWQRYIAIPRNDDFNLTIQLRPIDAP